VTITSIKFPQSVRAINRRASNLSTQGYTALGIKILQQAMVKHPHLTLRLNAINLKCSLKQSSNQDFDELIKHINRHDLSKDDRNPLIAVFNLLANGDCVDNSLMYYESIVNAIKHNSGYNNPILTSTINFHEAYILLRKGEYEVSLQLFQKYFDDYSKFEDIIYIAELLIELNQNQRALQLLKKLELKLNQITHKYNDFGFLATVTNLIKKIKISENE
jgi:tetratricopeptide (TPR) repeat protein